MRHLIVFGQLRKNGPDADTGGSVVSPLVRRPNDVDRLPRLRDAGVVGVAHELVCRALGARQRELHPYAVATLMPVLQLDGEDEIHVRLRAG